MTKVYHPTFLINVVLLLLLTTLFHAGIPPVTGKIPALIVFGDSTVDTGNNNAIKTLLKANFDPYGRNFEGGRPTGRFSNGRIVTDFLSEYFGLKKIVPPYLDPTLTIKDFATGVVFASAGTGYDNKTASVLNVIPLWKQVMYYKEYQKRLRDYLGDHKANETIREAVYLTSIGTNDFLENYFLLPTTKLHFTVPEFEDHIIEIARNFVMEIYSLGARKISLAGLPPMGCLPLERTINLKGKHECNKYYNRVALEFNGKFMHLVDQLNKELPGIVLVYVDLYYIVEGMITNPSLYGFTETRLACCGTGLLELSYLCKIDGFLSCPDPDKYLFWDGFHPTEKTNRIVGKLQRGRRIEAIGCGRMLGNNDFFV